MKRVIILAVVALIVVLMGAWIAVGHASNKGIEEPAFTIIKTGPLYEIRDYGPQIRAEVTIPGGYRETLYAGFRQIADYIFGNNTTRKEVAMTAPVLQEKSQPIAMTAPVLQEKAEKGNAFTVAFIMPREYSLESLPRPNNPAVRLRETPPMRYAVLRFSGYATEKRSKAKMALLLSALERDGIRPVSEPIVAQYNPPWTPPFMRRNEIQVAIP
ncbi:MAG TPA: heme-binding protein [Candidatus Hydrogenedentes bacterium]|nr:heme-binding protein [Candidatus Hydrogenedentota bacterium]HOT50026.1 heme-binding protein [Candidatus Hydrogenedentota bacterium]HOV74802.1 heme-binding protein [Candidatus Hydrogenedentota bacterium]HPC16849.1 heme-binding protein [Candidatus Hydrogenedentota bacterium]HRT21328.1 heme-binding protein [Candidatus Hydrogenedentota bacterium]